MKYQDKALQPLNQPQLKVPPDGGYGWVIVVAYALANVSEYDENDDDDVIERVHYVMPFQFDGSHCHARY